MVKAESFSQKNTISKLIYFSFVYIYSQDQLFFKSSSILPL